jgi:hypothetical protein
MPVIFLLQIAGLRDLTSRSPLRGRGDGATIQNQAPVTSKLAIEYYCALAATSY